MGCEMKASTKVLEGDSNIKYYSQYEDYQRNNYKNQQHIQPNSRPYKSETIKRKERNFLEEINDIDINNAEIIGDNLCVKQILGMLNEDSDFKDALITNQFDLETRLRDHIPTYFPDPENPNLPKPNLKDDFITKSVKIDFNKRYIIAINGINKVDKVEEVNGDYMIYHDNKPCRKDKYIALIVKKLDGEPQIKFNEPKPKTFGL